jgi:hypothetical protein
VKFSISVHSGFGAPADALDLLMKHIASGGDGTRFARRGAEITATWGSDGALSMERDERDEVGRLAVLGIVRGVCEGAPELEFDWFAVSPPRY